MRRVRKELISKIHKTKINKKINKIDIENEKTHRSKLEDEQNN